MRAVPTDRVRFNPFNRQVACVKSPDISPTSQHLNIIPDHENLRDNLEPFLLDLELDCALFVPYAKVSPLGQEDNPDRQGKRDESLRCECHQDLRAVLAPDPGGNDEIVEEIRQPREQWELYPDPGDIWHRLSHIALCRSIAGLTHRDKASSVNSRSTTRDCKDTIC